MVPEWSNILGRWNVCTKKLVAGEKTSAIFSFVAEYVDALQQENMEIS